MEIGASTGCLYPSLTENAVSELAENGFKKTEIFFNTFSELEPIYLDALKTILHKNNASVVSIHPFISSFESYMLFSDYERRFQDGIKLYELFFDAAHRLGAKYVVLHGLRKEYLKSSHTEELYFERFSALARHARKFDVMLLQENVNGHFADNPQNIRRMIDAIPDEARFVCDVKQAARAGYAPFEILDAIGTHLEHIHINDFSPAGECFLPGKGCFDFRAFFDFLKQNNYQGDIIIEVYRQNFGTISDLVHAKEFLEKQY